MCLEYVYENYVQSSKAKVSFAWKAMCKGRRPKEWVSTFNGVDKNNPLVENKWHKAIAGGSSLVAENGDRYPFGFHVFVSRQAARNFAASMGAQYGVVKVKVRNIVAIGENWCDFAETAPTLIAKEMLIIGKAR